MIKRKDEHCSLCPHRCKSITGKSGLCRIRSFTPEGWKNSAWGVPSALSIDPVEKKPFYHYHPGSKIFSVGFWGCNMHCPFCQNWQISQKVNIINKDVISPLDLLDRVKKSGHSLLAFTYNEPLIHYDYLLETAILADAGNIKVSLVTNGMLNIEYADKLLPYLDAVNVDLKSFSQTTYRKLGGDLNTVLSFIKRASELCHLELTTLIVPGLNDQEQEMEELAAFVAALSNETVLHLSSYYPAFRYQKPATTTETLETMLQIARRHLPWVYPGNSILSSDSKCPECNSMLIRRKGYQVNVEGFKGDTCRKCGRVLPFVT